VVSADGKFELSVKIHNMFHLEKVNYHSPPQAAATGFYVSVGVSIADLSLDRCIILRFLPYCLLQQPNHPFDEIHSLSMTPSDVSVLRQHPPSV